MYLSDQLEAKGLLSYKTISLRAKMVFHLIFVLKWRLYTSLRRKFVGSHRWKKIRERKRKEKKEKGKERESWFTSAWELIFQANFEGLKSIFKPLIINIKAELIYLVSNLMVWLNLIRVQCMLFSGFIGLF